MSDRALRGTAAGGHSAIPGAPSSGDAPDPDGPGSRWPGTPRQPLRGVIFDWGGVLTNPIIESVQAWLEAERIDRDSYVAAMRPWITQAYGDDQTESPVQALERGELGDADFEVILAGLLVDVDGGPVAASGLLARMFAASFPQPEMIDLVRELRGHGLRTGLLSNSWGWQNAYPWELLSELFDDVVISAQVGMRKPEERIFQLALRRLSLSPGECAFVDDVEGNVAAAQALGLVAVHHGEPAATRARLLELLAG